MDTVFLICAILGGTLVICQLVAGLFGFGARHAIRTPTTTSDADARRHGDSFFGMLSVRTAIRGGAVLRARRA